MADFKQYIDKLSQRLQVIQSMYNRDELVLSYDYLNKNNKVSHEVLYFKDGKEENSIIFVFGGDFFIDDLGEQEFKRNLALNSLNFKILRAYKILKKKQDRVKISDILNKLCNKKKDSRDVHVVLRRILTLSYYLNWKVVKDSQDIEGDSFIEIPDRFLFKLKQRYNFENMCSIYENDSVFIFLNQRGKLNMVFKEKNSFTKRDVERVLPNIVQKLFGVRECRFE